MANAKETMARKNSVFHSFIIDGNRAVLFGEIYKERERQDAKWGVQNHPIRPTDPNLVIRFKQLADSFKKLCNAAAESGNVTWYEILLEEVYEAFAEDTPEGQRAELVQVAAVAVSMIECIDRNTNG